MTTIDLTREQELLKLFLACLRQDQLQVVSETDPWGTLIATGDKANETRDWPARLSRYGSIYHGPLAIHLSKKMDNDICYREPFNKVLRAAGYQPSILNPRGNSWGLPLGHIVAITWLENVWQINERSHHMIPKEGSHERAFGNYQPGRYVWSFSCAYRLKQPILIERGAPSIWRWTPTGPFWSEIQGQADQLRTQLSKE